MRTPRTTAAIDQVEAWTRDLQGQVVGPDRLGLVKRFVDTMCARDLGGQETMCPHLDYFSGSLDWAFWVPSQPHVIRCHPCHREILDLLCDAEQLPCDACGAPGPPKDQRHFDAIGVPPTVLQEDDGSTLTVPPVAIVIVLCSACHAITGLPC